MLNYVIRRLVGAIPVLVGVIAVVFILTTIVPGDPARIMMGQRGNPETIAKIRHEMGLDKPLPIQFLDFMKNALTLNLGKSYRNNMTVVEAITTRIPVTFKLAFFAMVIAILVGVPLGIISAVKQYSWIDYGAMFFAILGISAPVFWVALLAVVLFCVILGWIPGTGTGNGELIYYVLPSIVLGLRPAALIARLTRSSMLEIVRQDYIRTARAKGLSERVVIMRHALRNALIPVVTVIGIEVASLLSGVVITEQIFSLPGIGRLSVEALTNRDFPVIRGVVLFMAFIFVLANLIVDLSYPFFDPRIKYD
ncbi:putative peptide transporter permease subunit: membrane component of ABC superfamily [Tepidanaerobacter acetatoxydans Re1]|uniref:Putative peptide transporter permease subunit: membrane component of ABC superfamily n=1 Tax=Tepidanaerobacter acetatoxydans (strain DSM 21804 / JCM 16047 / Re1) TaxID=1209989 RepID=F4LQM9_TEPAE|nr:ABC transporter permease [Tepidanaerobacter acetatoxydans]AEE92032.1 ABC-type transporter, integral membrane subunit [Tepidanaerobacter acetatoxydans Re1]CCP26871.1 putative peptide transporter permease subunit: membrane component of ABC superfamily [Tepidanaerobacter acetatoxydans Re1]